MAQGYWHKWQRIYLPTLIPRKKWNSTQTNFKLGVLILLKNFTMLKNQWSRGRVYRVIPNKDGIVCCLEI